MFKQLGALGNNRKQKKAVAYNHHIYLRTIKNYIDIELLALLYFATFRYNGLRRRRMGGRQVCHTWVIGKLLRRGMNGR